jgi:hypothetical protein
MNGVSVLVRSMREIVHPFYSVNTYLEGFSFEGKSEPSPILLVL